MSVLDKIDKKLKENFVGAAGRVEYVCKGPHQEACERGNKKKKKVEEQIDLMVMQPDLKLVSDHVVFGKMADLIMSLEPDQLDEIQLQRVVDIIDKIQTEAELDEMALKKAKPSTQDQKKYAKNYYSKNKDKILKKREQFEKQTVKGKARKRMQPYAARGNMTATYSSKQGSPATATFRKKVKYNV